jgi:hypothetical protein
VKLLMCGRCGDIRRVKDTCITVCDCGDSLAWHTNHIHVEVEGKDAHKVFLDNRQQSLAYMHPFTPGRLYLQFEWRNGPRPGEKW